MTIGAGGGGGVDGAVRHQGEGVTVTAPPILRHRSAGYILLLGHREKKRTGGVTGCPPKQPEPWHNWQDKGDSFLLHSPWKLQHEDFVHPGIILQTLFLT